MAEVGAWNEAVSELDAIVAYLDGPDVNVDELLNKLARGTEIIDALEQRLSATRARVEELAPRTTVND
jgi:exodeoxyribonuclease VII small subunit